ncbi:hypothetical protein A1OE_1203 [Candidatus Endolissoclinum faulkneri L2]|uniref:Uncharacterized protein n=1 Tax=Candidatus Endolissoclinum faulkneri L2 TaxID=1193729 RepID=K7YS55_9PROT|nr:hypothetical protein A1OE_1203 [Candidatus Endolissoclinum faulkneri L2]
MINYSRKLGSFTLQYCIYTQYYILLFSILNTNKISTHDL